MTNGNIVYTLRASKCFRVGRWLGLLSVLVMCFGAIQSQASTFTLTRSQVLDFSASVGSLDGIVDRMPVENSLIFSGSNLQPSHVAGFTFARFGLGGVEDFSALGFDTFALNVQSLFDNSYLNAGWLVRLVAGDVGGNFVTSYDGFLPGTLGGPMTLSLAALDLTHISFLGFEAHTNLNAGIPDEYGPGIPPVRVVFPGGDTYSHATIDGLFAGSDVSVVPVPAALPMLMSGLALLSGIGFVRRKRAASR